MWIILFYILPVILGILTWRKINKYGIKNGDDAMTGIQSVLAIIACIIPIINIALLIAVWIIAIRELLNQKDQDFINIKWLNRLFGTKD